MEHQPQHFVKKDHVLLCLFNYRTGKVRGYRRIRWVMCDGYDENVSAARHCRKCSGLMTTGGVRWHGLSLRQGDITFRPDGDDEVFPGCNINRLIPVMREAYLRETRIRKTEPACVR